MTRFENVKIVDEGYCRLKKDIKGHNNIIKIGSETRLEDVEIVIKGNDNSLIIDDNCIFGKRCMFRLEGNNITIHIGENTTATRDTEICAQEDNSTIDIGDNCMFSNTIVVRTSDSHPVFDKTTQRRINEPGNVTIGSRVWIAPNSKIMKGVTIGDGAIVGSDTIVTKDVPCNCLCVGHPGTIVKRNIEWTREQLF